MVINIVFRALKSLVSWFIPGLKREGLQTSSLFSDERQHSHLHKEGNHGSETENPHQKGSIMTLSKARIGDRMWLAGFESKEGINGLVGMGLAPGMGMDVVKNIAGNIVVAVGDTRIGIGGGMAKRILVSDQPLNNLVSDQPFHYLAEVQEVDREMENSKTTLRDLQVNQKGKVARYEATDDASKKAYRKKLLAMGLTPGTEFTVTRVAPLGDPVEIQVRGFKLSLRKDEAAALVVEVISNK